MAVDENVAAAKAGYAAFAKGDAAGAMKDMADDIEWVVRGDSAVSGTKRGKEELGAYWGQLAEKKTMMTPSRFLGDGNTVVVLTDIEIGGARTSAVDVLEYNEAGKLIRFEAFGGEAISKQAFG